MTTTALLIPMTRTEAQSCVDDIKAHTGKLRQLVHDFYHREGWKALGYESFAACAEAQFERSYQYIYKQLSASKVDANLRLFSPQGENVTLPVPHAKELNALPTAERQYQAYTKAQALAKAEGAKDVATRHVAAAVRAVAMEMRVATIPLLSHLVTSGAMSVEDADESGARLDKLTPTARGYVFQQIATAGGISDPALVTFIGEQYQRQTDDQPSQVLEVLDATGYIGGEPLKRANMTNVKRALYEQQLERESDEAQGADDYGPVHLTLLARNAEASWKELQTMMGEAWIDMMRPLFMKG